MPAMVLLIVAHAVLRKVDILDAFIEGAFSGMKTVYNVFPTFVGLMFAVSIIRSSGILDIISRILSPVTDPLGLPAAALPLTFMRLVSSSAATGLLLDIFKNFGPDSYVGRFTSVMMSCTETVFYTMSVYFMSVKITKTKYALSGALLANIVGVIASIFITKYVFY
jgi:spore maturation protein B